MSTDEVPREPIPPIWHQAMTVRLLAAAGAVIALYGLTVWAGYNPRAEIRPWLRGEGGAPYVAFLFTVCKTLAGLAIVWQFQRSRDRSTGVNWKDVKARLDAGNLAWALYRSIIFLGSCLLVGTMMS